MSLFPTAEGFYDVENSKYIWQYKDHLGNVRLSYAKDNAGALEIVDMNDFYPFGMNFVGYYSVFDAQGSFYNYKYNGKELQETGMYDYGARFYMPDIGRWGVVDPLAEVNRAWSTYRYAYDNPLRFIDPDGRLEDWFENEQNGNIEWHDGSAERAGYTNITQKAAGKQIQIRELDGQGNTVALNRLNNDGSITRNGETITNGYSTVTVLGRTITSRDPWAAMASAQPGDPSQNGNPFANIDARETANTLENVGFATETASLVLAPETGGASLAGVPVADVIGGVGTAINTGLDLQEGKYGSAIFRVAKFAAFQALGKGIDKVSESTVSKTVLNANKIVGDKTIDYVFEQSQQKKK